MADGIEFEYSRTQIGENRTMKRALTEIYVYLSLLAIGLLGTLLYYEKYVVTCVGFKF